MKSQLLLNPSPKAAKTTPVCTISSGPREAVPPPHRGTRAIAPSANHEEPEIRDLFSPSQRGQRSRTRCLYQMAKKLGLHRPMEAQAQPQDSISKTLRLGQQLNCSTQNAISTAREHWLQEAKGAKGGYRMLVGSAQGFTEVGQAAFSSSKNLLQQAGSLADFGYRGLKGNVDFEKLLREGAEESLKLPEKVCRYVASGQVLQDGKKFSRACAGVWNQLCCDPSLEVPKALSFAAGTAALAAAGRVLSTPARCSPPPVVNPINEQLKKNLEKVRARLAEPPKVQLAPPPQKVQPRSLPPIPSLPAPVEPWQGCLDITV